MKKFSIGVDYLHQILCTKTFKIMRNTLLLLLLNVFQMFGTSSYSQMTKLTLNLNNVTVKEALSDIEQQSKFFFLYNSKLVDVNKVVNLNVKEEKIDLVLAQLFHNTTVKYVVFNRQIILTPGEYLNNLNVRFQQITVSGTVTDENNQPLPGVTVLEKGTNNGTITNASGEYTIAVSPGAILAFSFVGMEAQEVEVGDKTTIDITLTGKAVGLEEVVAVGYGTQKKINLTGAVDQIDSKTFNDFSVPNITRALQGAIPNLNISFNNGRPTSNPQYNIRGLTSIGAGGEALILIDGVVGDPLTLNPNDIESVTVLKDAASAAIYGARGAFGVVLFTTKKPKKTQITYSSNYSANYKTVEPHIVTDSYLWAKMYNESYSAWYDYTKGPSSIGASGLSFSPDYLQELKNHSEHPELPTVEIDPSNGNYVYYGNTNWYDLLYSKNNPSLEQSFNASGRGEKTDYSISGQYFTQDGLYKIRSDNYNKYNLRFYGGIQVTDWLKVSSNVLYSSYKYSDPFSGSSIWNTLNTNGNGVPMAVMFNPDGTMTKTASQGAGILYGKSNRDYKQNRFQQTLGFDLTLIKNMLSIKGDFTYQNTYYEIDSKSVPIPFSLRPGVLSTNGSSSLAATNQKTNYFDSNVYANFAHRFGNHDLKVLVGENLESSKFKNLYVSRTNLILDQLSDFNLTTGDVFNIDGGGNEWGIFGLFSRINYNYKQKYLLEINGRYDGSSKFPRSDHFGFFPSASIGWRINEENFMQGTSRWLDNLKIRTSYGSLGNSQIAPYLYLEQIQASKSSRIIQGQLPVYINSPKVLADNFTWETSTTFDIGADIDLFKGRLGSSFDWYKRATTNMITPGPVLPAVFGASSPTGNYADLETKGFEFTLRWNDQINTGNKPIFYGIRLTLADNVAHITRYNNPNGLINVDPYTGVADYYKGMRYGDIWGYVTEGLFTSDEDIANHADQSYIQSSNLRIALPGDVKFKDLNNDGKIDKGDKTLANHGDWKIIGNSRPRYSFGASLNADWNNFALSAFFQGIAKQDWYPPYGFTQFWGQYTVWYSYIPEHTLKDAYTLDNPDPNAYWPRYKGPSPYGDRGLQPQTRYLQNAAYIRLKDLTLSYTLPKSAVDKIRLSKVRVYLSGQNIWTYSPIFKITKDIDPEAIDGRGNFYPMLKTYTLGLSVTL